MEGGRTEILQDSWVKPHINGYTWKCTRLNFASSDFSIKESFFPNDFPPKSMRLQTKSSHSTHPQATIFYIFLLFLSVFEEL